jgi:hypothetical protein
MLTECKSAALLAAIKEYDQNKWKVIGQKVGKPAKVGDQGVPYLWWCYVGETPLTDPRRASSMRRNISEGKVERLMDRTCIFPSLARWLLFMIPALFHI